jgi:hypothetical protein
VYMVVLQTPSGRSSIRLVVDRGAE